MFQFIKNLFASDSRKSSKPRFRPMLECLEERALMAANVELWGVDIRIMGDYSRNAQGVVEVQELQIIGTSETDHVVINQVGDDVRIVMQAGGGMIRDYSLTALVQTQYMPYVDGEGPPVVRFSSQTTVEFRGLDGGDLFINNTGLETWAFGGAGDDYLEGGFGFNHLNGEDDNDTLVGKQTITIMAGPGDGFHQFFTGGAGNDVIKGTNANDIVFGNAGDDEIRGFGGNDLLIGDDMEMIEYGWDFINGGDGDDRLIGGLGSDRLYGELGVDQMFGNADRDYLDGGNDARFDTLLGGTGPDIFVFRSDALDLYKDFSFTDPDSYYVLTPMGNGQYKYPALTSWLETTRVSNDLIVGSKTWSFASGENSSSQSSSTSTYSTYDNSASMYSSSSTSSASTYSSSSYMYADSGSYSTYEDSSYMSADSSSSGAASTYESSSLYVIDHGDGDIGALVLAEAMTNPGWLGTEGQPEGELAGQDGLDFAHLDYVAATEISAMEPSQAYQLDQELGLRLDASGLWENCGGKGEKWLVGDDGWYFILPSGELYKWDGSSGATGTLIAKLDAIYHEDPSLLYDAQLGSPEELPAPSLVEQVQQLDAELGLRLDASGLWENCCGRNEKWIVGNDGWYFILPTGELYQWDGSSAATGTLIATLEAMYYEDPSLLYDAQPAMSAADVAHQLNQDLGLRVDASGLWENCCGRNEKWLVGNDGWYFILPTGELYKWDGSSAATGELIGTLEVGYYEDVNLLCEA